VLGLQAPQPDDLLRSLEPGLGAFGEGEEVLRVPAADIVLVATGGQPLQRKLADRLQHGVARRRPVLGAPHQALVDQHGQSVQDVAVAVDHGLGGVQRPAAGEHPEPPEERLLCLAEEVVAPGDRIAQRPLAGGQVARAAGQRQPPIAQPGQQRRRREDPALGGGQLDRQRQPVQPPADVDHHPGVLGGQDE
jgi:hypothetical protein